MVPLAGARISREIDWSGWPGGVFLGIKPGLDGLGVYFLRKTNEKYVQISFFHKKSKIHRFLIDFFLLTKFQNLALMRNLRLEATIFS